MTTSTTLQQLANSIPPSVWIPVATSTVIPYLAALVSKKPSSWTGVATALLSIASGFLGDWLAKGSDFDWKLALVAAAGTWFASTKWHDKVAKDGPLLAAAYHALGGTNVWDVSTLPPADLTAPELAHRPSPSAAYPVSEPAVAGEPPAGDEPAGDEPGRHEAPEVVEG